MFHICRFNTKLIGLAYDFYQGTESSSQGIVYFELYKCKVCGKLIKRNSAYVKYNISSNNAFLNDFIINLKSVGYKPIGELLSEYN